MLPLACAAYNFMPNEHSKESPFFLMFGRDPVLLLNTLLEPKIRYMGTDKNIISLESMKNLYEIVATNLKLEREKGDPQEQPPPTKLQPGDTVLIQNHTRGPFEPKYIGDYRVVSLKGNQVEIKPAIRGSTEIKHIKHVKYVLPADKYTDQLPNYSWFGRKITLRIDPDQIPDLHWKLANTYHTTNIRQTEVKDNTVHNITLNTHVDTDNTILSTEIHTTQSRSEPLICSILPIT